MSSTNENMGFSDLPGTPAGQDNDKVMPIAIVGVGGRFPGDASNPEKLWDLLCNGRSALTDIPKDRFNVDAFYHPHAERAGSQNFRGAHFMNRAPEAFDAPFFSITPNEAKAMDPQQRMCLEVAYEAMENAGIPMESVVGSTTSCYVGCFTQDYHNMMSHDPENFPAYFPTGVAAACLSNRVSWFYDLRGPSMTIDTACSSSLVALHLACQSIRTGESSLAICGGVNFMISPEYNVTMSTLHFLTPDSKCQTFDEKGNGYARGEGTSFVVLKPLAAALRDNDVIRAVIRNTGTNQDGNTPGITLPSTDAQATLIRKVYSDAGLDLADTGYFEAHGTGTAAGDPIETSALGATFGKSRRENDPLYVGSIKANIGHLEGASGLAGLTKALYVLENAVIPPQIWLDKVNPRILLDEWKLAIPRQLTPWPKEGLRRVSINSFGFGGANAHAVLDDAYHYMKLRGIKGHHNTVTDSYTSSPDSSSDSAISLTSPPEHSDNEENPLDLENASFSLKYHAPKLVVWSAHEQSGIKRISETYGSYLTEKLETTDVREENTLLDQFAFTTAAKRSILPWKSFTVGSSLKELAAGMDDAVKPIRSSRLPKLGFVFTGQGAQHFAMGRELWAHEVYAESLRAASAHLVSLGCTWSLVTELWQDEKSSKIDNPSYSQPICTAVQVALVELLQHWGIKPTAVVGHSSGEIAAAFAKGSISREDAWAVAYHRGRLSSLIPELAPQLQGSMLATGVGETDAKAYLEKTTKGKATIACINSPSSVTISGDLSAVMELEAMLKADGLFARRLKVETAYHSFHMEVISELYLNSLSELQTLPEDPTAPKMFSSVTGSLIQNSELGAEYWVSNMLNTVRFSEAVKSLSEHSDNQKRRRAKAKPYVDIMLEVGPHGALQGPVKQILASIKAECLCMSALTRGKDSNQTTLDVVGRLFQQGYPANIAAANNVHRDAGNQKMLVDMPPFPWNHTNKYWHESALAHSYRFRKTARKDLLGLLADEWNVAEPRWRNFFRLSENPWIEDHSVHNTLLYPAAGMMVMALEAAAEIADPAMKVDGYELRDVIVGNALIVPRDEDGVETMLHLKPWRMGSQATTSAWNEFTIFSRPGKEAWSKNCSGLLRVNYKQTTTNPTFNDETEVANAAHKTRYEQARRESTTIETSKHFYEHQANIGLQLGVTFRNLIDINKGHNQSACTVKIPDMASTMPHQYQQEHVIHPCTLDAIIQTLLPTVEGQNENLKVAAIPTYIEKLYVSADISAKPGTEFQTYSIAGYTGLKEAEASVFASAPGWEKPLVVFEKIRATRLSAMTDVTASGQSSASLRRIAGEFHWKEDVSNMDRTDIQAFCAASLPDAKSLAVGSIDEMEFTAFIYIKRVLQACTEKEAEGFEPHLRRLYQSMQQSYQKVESTRFDWLDTSLAFEKNLLSGVAASSIDGALLCRVGESLISIMRGEIEAEEVLMKDDLLAVLETYGLGRPESHTQLSSYISLLGHRSPGMKILEIGVQNGAITETILKVLGEDAESTPWFKSYTCTDFNQTSLDNVSAKFAAWASYVTFKKLDIEQDPVQQGLQAGDYDLIVASNLTRTASDINTAIRNARTLLKAGGKLVLGEVTQESLRYPIIFGAMDRRIETPMLTEDKWDEAFRQNGFSGIDVVLPDWQDAKNQSFSFLSTTAHPASPESLPEDVLIIEAHSTSLEAQALSEDLSRCLHNFGITASTTTLQGTTSLDLTGKACIVLAEVEDPLLFGIDAPDFEAVKRLILESASTTWITRGGAKDCEHPKLSLITGLSRSIRQENPGLAISTLDLDPEVAIGSSSNAGFIVKALRCHSRIGGDSEFAVRANRMMVPRVHLQKGANELIATHNVEPTPEPAPLKQLDRALTLTVGVPGMLDTLHFKDDETYQLPLKTDDVEIEVKASGLNFMDIMVAMDQIQEPAVGLECSGIVTRVGPAVSKFKVGDRVMTWLLGGFSNYARNSESMFQFVPEDMSFETAASLPMIYCTAYQALVEAARLEKDEKVLIHAAAGGVGQAAIMIAQHVGAEIFATVGSQAKKQHIMEKYGIAEDHIFNSRDLSFADGVKRMTDGKGVDVVLNSLAGEALRQSWLCLAWFGRFVELGKKDITGNTGLDMAPFIRNMSFHSVNVIGTLRESIPRASKLFNNTMAYFFNHATCRPVNPVTTMDFSQIEEGFRLLQSGKHMGKVVFKAHDNDMVPVIPRKVKTAKFDPEATYVLSGGLGGLGRSLSQWMVDHGAKNLAFFSRSGAAKPDAKAVLEKLAKDGVRAVAYACDIGNPEQVERAVEKCRAEMPPIRGLIQAAMSLADAAFNNMTQEQWTLSVNPKAPGTWNLHKYMPEEMDFFVMLSSSSGIAGTRGQGNYAAGNTFQDALAHYRRAQNLPAVAIDVGPVTGVGYVAENSELIDSLAAQGYVALREEELIALLQAAVTGETINGEETPGQVITGFATGGLVAVEGWDMPYYLEDAKMGHIIHVDTNGNTATNDAGAGWQSQLSQLSSISAGSDLVAAALGTKLAKLMMVAAEDIDMSKPISTYGVDSLTAVEIRAWSFRELQSDISVFDIMSNIPISSLARTIVVKSKFVAKEIVEADN